jgi:hypothetical protein
MSRIEDALARANEKRIKCGADGNGARGVIIGKSLPDGGKRLWMYGISLALLLGAGLYYSNYSTRDQGKELLKTATVIVAVNSSAAEQQTMHAKATQREQRLPSCILANSPDQSYSATHPGWQRYENDVLEFRVYREGPVIKAIQGIGRNGKTISGEFFASFLKETAGIDSFRLHSREKREGSLVEKGLVGSVAEVIVYRNNLNGQIIAFVLAYL